ncbi:MAG TPA: 2-amino-4-hydroxy-6-hydroxymethyldihydropteridine diphosphokinase [Dissulfurispiraceae bacterium]|nr:2-amino-4-hydroxy-6-hydroxymethyldihydropteridine diphosphokinase [Dissulfurispiraceae bacterium]
MVVAYIGIGSNLGDREGHCWEAISRLKDAGCEAIAASSLIETEPWGLSDQPRFINGAVAIRTGLSPEELLQVLKSIEAAMFRQHGEKWGPRFIDLDILLYGDVVLNTAQLVIPHPLLHNRGFALEPLAEIAPDTVHPVFEKTIGKLLEVLKRHEDLYGDKRDPQ